MELTAVNGRAKLSTASRVAGVFILKSVLLHEPNRNEIENPSQDYLHSIFVSPTLDYWLSDYGGASIKYTYGEFRSELYFLYREEHGFYLRFREHRDGSYADWLSLGNREELNNVIDAGDEWYVSVGLFIPAAQAALAAYKFNEAGQRSTQIDWIAASDMPEDSNFF